MDRSINISKLPLLPECWGRRCVPLPPWFFFTRLNRTSLFPFKVFKCNFCILGKISSIIVTVVAVIVIMIDIMIANSWQSLLCVNHCSKIFNNWLKIETKTMSSYYNLSPIPGHKWFSALVYTDKRFLLLHWFCRKEFCFICYYTSPDRNEWVKQGHVQDNVGQYQPSTEYGKMFHGSY